MKKPCLLFIISILTLSNVLGEIKNGYETEIFQVQGSLKALRLLLHGKNTLTASQTQRIEYRIESLIKYISYYELTENLLNQFRIIAPALYNEIDAIKDGKGRTVDVYVKFIPQAAAKVKAWGTTHMDQVENDKDACRSEYGERTVSVKIWIVNCALLVLSHELGHVKYQARHFANYTAYYRRHYYNTMDNPSYMGHASGDPSGKSAYQYEKIFRKEYASFLSTTEEKIQSPLALMESIIKNLVIG
jgi:hypothetical protein